jgi:hypothetical protein
MNHHSKEEKTLSIAIIAIVAALALLGVVIVLAITTLPTMQEAEARGCESGFPNSFIGVNASQARCFGH